MRAAEDRSWWFVGKRMLVEVLLRQVFGPGPYGRVLDVGCGTGATLALLARVAEPYGIDCALTALRFSAERRVAHLCACDAERLSFVNGVFTAVTALDVIEHLDHPIQALREMARVCAPNGVVLLTVPAYPILWSDHDVALDHRRRYTPRLLCAQVEAAGLEVVRLSHAYLAFFLPVLLIRRLRRFHARHATPEADLGVVAGPLNAFMTWYMRLEAAALRWVNLPVGTSLLCVARPRSSSKER